MFLAIVLTLETGEMFAIFVFTTKTTQPRRQVFSVNGALTYNNTNNNNNNDNNNNNNNKYYLARVISSA